MCPAGINVAASWDFFLSGKSAARKCEKLEGLEIDYACCIPDFDPDKFLDVVWQGVLTDLFSWPWLHIAKQ